MAMQQPLARLARARMPAGDYQVLFALLGRLDWDNYIHLDLTELASELNRHRTGVSRAVSRLVAAGVLHRGPRVGQNHTYRLDPNLGWKGRPAGRRQLQAELDRRGWRVHDGDDQAGDDRTPTIPGL